MLCHLPNNERHDPCHISMAFYMGKSLITWQAFQEIAPSLPVAGRRNDKTSVIAIPRQGEKRSCVHAFKAYQHQDFLDCAEKIDLSLGGSEGDVKHPTEFIRPWCPDQAAHLVSIDCDIHFAIGEQVAIRVVIILAA